MTDARDAASTRAIAALAAADLGRGHAELAPMTPGWGSTELWRFVDRSGRPLVLRVFARLDATVLVERETAAHRAAHAAGVSVPEVLETVALDGAAAMITTFRPGRTLAAALLDLPGDAYGLGRECGAILARIHTVPAPAVVAARSWRDWPRPDVLGARLTEAVGRLVREADQGPEVLLHLDLHPENVLVRAGEDGVPHVSAVLDWTNARSGPAAADLARSLAIVDLVRERPELSDAAASLTAYAEGLVDGHGSGEPSAALRWWALACQITDLAPIVARPGGWLQRSDLVGWRRRLEVGVGG